MEIILTRWKIHLKLLKKLWMEKTLMKRQAVVLQFIVVVVLQKELSTGMNWVLAIKRSMATIVQTSTKGMLTKHIIAAVPAV
jgi:hypothetical protein